MKKIVIQRIGDHPVRVLRLLRTTTGVGLKVGVAIRDTLPGVLLDGVADDKAGRIRGAFQSIGANVVLENTETTVEMIRLSQELKTLENRARPWNTASYPAGTRRFKVNGIV